MLKTIMSWMALGQQKPSLRPLEIREDLKNHKASKNKSQGQFIVYVLSAKSTILDGYIESIMISNGP